MSDNHRRKFATSTHLVYGPKKWQWCELETTTLNCVKELSPSFETAEEAEKWARQHIQRK